MNRLILALGASALVFALPAQGLAQQAPPPRMYGVKLAVSDVARTTRFYEILGMKAGRRHNEWEAELSWEDPSRGSAIIMVDGRFEERFHVKRGGATMIIGAPDVYAAIASLRAAGFTITAEPRTMGQAAIAMIQDPDGNWIELAGPARAAAPPK